MCDQCKGFFIGMHAPNMKKWHYENDYFFHKGKWVTQKMLDDEKRQIEVDKIMNDETLTRREKIQKAMSVKL